jgi:hypothetical protein
VDLCCGTWGKTLLPRDTLDGTGSTIGKAVYGPLYDPQFTLVHPPRQYPSEVSDGLWCCEAAHSPLEEGTSRISKHGTPASERDGLL